MYLIRERNIEGGQNEEKSSGSYFIDGDGSDGIDWLWEQQKFQFLCKRKHRKCKRRGRR